MRELCRLRVLAIGWLVEGPNAWRKVEVPNWQAAGVGMTRPERLVNAAFLLFTAVCAVLLVATAGGEVLAFLVAAALFLAFACWIGGLGTWR